MNLIVYPLFCYFGIVFVFYLGQRRLIYLASHEFVSTPAQYGISFKEVTIPVNDSVSINGWWITQPNSSSAPTLLYCHGNGGNLTFYAEVAKIFYDYGWNALLFDYRGYGKSSKIQPTEEGLILDAGAAYEWIKVQGFQESQIFVWGHSLGSAVAARLATHNNPAALILENPFSTLYDEARAAYPWLVLFPQMVWDKFETVRYVANRSMPLLVIHAEYDEIIPIKLGRKVFEAASEPKQFLLLPGINHTGFPSVHTTYREQITNFVSQSINKIAWQ